MVMTSLRKPRVLLLGALGALSLAAFIALTRSVNAGNGKWAPAEWDDIGTLEILTAGPEEGEHWSKLWLAVIDGAVYVRLGSRAADRFERNTTSPFVRVRIAGEEFSRVRATPAAEMGERVGAEMADKYWSDFFVRLVPHRLVVRLMPEP